MSPQTVRNYVEEQGVEVIQKLLESARKMSLETLKGVREIDLSIDWTTKTWYGRPVGGAREFGGGKLLELRNCDD